MRADRPGSTSPGTRWGSNQFGLHEFVSGAEALGTEVMLAVNLGTADP
jgi:alpha-L-arabinofuranosidase